MSSRAKSTWSRLKWSAFLAWHIRSQRRLPFRPRLAIDRLQTRRLRAMVHHAYRTVPYYRRTMDRMGLKPGDLREVKDLARLPLIDPAQLQQDPNSFVSTARPTDRYILVRTGGSTGDPRPVYHDAADILQNAAHGERERCIISSLVGRRFGYRETIIISLNCTARKLQDFARSHAILPSRLAIRRQYLSLTDPTEKNVRLINEFRPDVIQSYGSYLGILFSHLADTGQGFHRPKVVTYSSDSLTESVRRLIQERFGIPVFSTYQANEAWKIGFECESHLGLHLNTDLYPVRIVDESGNDRPPGETGEVVVCNLVNRAMVLLNYRLGDLAAMLPGPCPCGRTLPLLSFPPGRSDDLIVLPSGRLVHPQLARTVFTVEQQVWQYQVVQLSAASLDVKVVVARGADRPAIRRRVEERFTERLGPEVQLSVSFVDSIDRTVGGKFRSVISLCGQAGSRQAGSGPDAPWAGRFAATSGQHGPAGTKL